jgi:clan AA aspartic protease (TIGR02281 family)
MQITTAEPGQPKASDLECSTPLAVCGLQGILCGIWRIFPSWVAALCLSGVATLDLFAVEEFPPISLGEAQSQLQAMEQVMEARFRHVPGLAVFEAANNAISNYNASCEAKEQGFAERRAKLDAELKSIHQQEAELKGVDARLKATTPRQVDRTAMKSYNARVGERNRLAEKLTARAGAYKTAVASYNAAILQFNRESENHRRKLEGVAEAAAGRLKDQRKWLMNRGDVEFYRRVNEFNARVLRAFGDGATGRHSECVRRAAALRAELGEMAAREEMQRTNGLVIVETLLGDRIKCHMIVDTGASTVTISSAVASMLGLANRSAVEVESTLAGGLVIKGRKVTLPSVSVQGQRVSAVEAIVIPETSCGVDGLLGHSYLDHFSYRFDKGRNPAVRLWPKGSGGGER